MVNTDSPARLRCGETPLIKTFVPGSLTRYPFHFPAHRGITISFADGSRFFVALATAGFGKNPGTFAGPAKSS